MNAFQSIPQDQQAEFMRHLERMQHQDSLRMYNNLVARCFNECAKSFKSKKLDDKEIKCVETCADKFIKLTQRVGFRFAEHQSHMAGGAIAGAPPGSGVPK